MVRSPRKSRVPPREHGACRARMDPGGQSSCNHTHARRCSEATVVAHPSSSVWPEILLNTGGPIETRESLGLTGHEVIDVTGIASGLKPGGTVQVTAKGADGKVTKFDAVVRLNSPVELEYYRHGGILPRVLRMFMEG